MQKRYISAYAFRFSGVNIVKIGGRPSSHPTLNVEMYIPLSNKLSVLTGITFFGKENKVGNMTLKSGNKLGIRDKTVLEGAKRR